MASPEPASETVPDREQQDLGVACRCLSERRSRVGRASHLSRRRAYATRVTSWASGMRRGAMTPGPSTYASAKLRP